MDKSIKYKLKTAIHLALPLIAALIACEPTPDTTPWGPPEGLFVMTTDYETGSFSIVDPLTLQTYNDVGVRRVHYDAFARYFQVMPGYVYVINRFGQDNIQILDRMNNYATIAQESTGQLSNPQDIAVVSDMAAYVTRYNSNALWIIDPATAIQTGEIDLSSYADPGAGGVPYMSHAYYHESGGRSLVFVALQRLGSGMNPTDYSSVVVIEADSSSPNYNTTIAEIRLQWDTESATNPYSAFRPVPAAWWQPATPDGHDHLFISCVGKFGYSFALDCGIVAIDPVDFHCEEGYIFSETDIGSEITDFIVKSGSTAYATTSDSEFISRLVSFNPQTGEIASVLRQDSGDWGYLWSLALHPSGELFVCDRNALDPGVRVYDTNASDAEMNGGRPLYVGLPPFDLVFIE